MPPRAGSMPRKRLMSLSAGACQRRVQRAGQSARALGSAAGTVQPQQVSAGTGGRAAGSWQQAPAGPRTCHSVLVRFSYWKTYNCRAGKCSSHVASGTAYRAISPWSAQRGRQGGAAQGGRFAVRGRAPCQIGQQPPQPAAGPACGRTQILQAAGKGAVAFLIVARHTVSAGGRGRACGRRPVGGAAAAAQPRKAAASNHRPPAAKSAAAAAAAVAPQDRQQASERANGWALTAGPRPGCGRSWRWIG